MRAITLLQVCALILVSIIFEIPTVQAGDQARKSAFDGLMIRGRAAVVIPQESADIGVIGGDIDIDKSLIPELDISYFFTENIAAELILAITPHNAQATNTSLGRVNLGDVWLLPPTLLLQYHLPTKYGFKPYVGAGLNYTVFFDESAAGGTVTDIDFEDTIGYAVQFGVDYMLDEHWLLNLDVKKLWINTDVSINNGAINADVDINPWIVGVGVGYRF